MKVLTDSVTNLSVLKHEFPHALSRHIYDTPSSAESSWFTVWWLWFRWQGTALKNVCACARFMAQSRTQRPRSFWLAAGITTSGQVQLRKSPIHGLPALCACSKSSVTNLIGSSLNLLCLQSHSKPGCRWTWPRVPIFPAHDKRDRLGRGWARAVVNGLGTIPNLEKISAFLKSFEWRSVYGEKVEPRWKGWK